MVKYELTQLVWDTNHFGLSTAKLILRHHLEPSELSSLSNELNTFDLVYVYSDRRLYNSYFLSNIPHIYLVDVAVKLETKTCKELDLSEFCKVLPAKSVSDDVILLVKSISNDSFKHSRFFKDPYVSKKLAQGIYDSWLANSRLHDNKFFLLFQNFGYVLFNISTEIDGSSLINIELISVSKDARGSGIGTKMLNYLLHHAYLNHINRVVVETQVDNLEAMNLYIKCGFSITDVYYVYHHRNSFKDWGSVL